MKCSIAAEDVFGPTVEGCLDGFDFTLLFEEGVMTIGPLGLVLALLVAPRIAILGREKEKARRGVAYFLKLFAWALYAILQLVLLVVLATQDVPRTRLSVASVALNLAAALVFCYLSHLEHTRSVRPSTILTLSLLSSLLFDVARTRTLWAIYDNALVAALFTSTLPVKLCVLLLESRGKRGLIIRSPEKSYPPEAVSGIINRSLFWWLNPLFLRGFRETLSVEKLFDVDKYLGAEWAGQRLQGAWDKLTATEYPPKSPNALAFLILKQFRWQLCAAIIPRLMLTGFTFCQPFAANRFMDYISSDDTTETKAVGFGLVGAYAIIYIGIAVATALYHHQVNRLAAMVRAALIPVIYQKTLTIPSNNTHESSGITMLSTDLERIAFGMRDAHELWAGLIEIALAIWLLERQLGVASVMPAALFIVCTLLTVQFAGIAANRQKVWLQANQKRLSRTTDALKNLKVIKMTGLADLVSKAIVDLRVNEIKSSTMYRTMLIIVVVLSYGGTVLTPMFTLAVFTFIAQARGNNTTLDNTKAVTSLILFNLFGSPMSLLIDAIAGIATAFSSLQRIQAYLGEDHQEDARLLTGSSQTHVPWSAGSMQSIEGSEEHIALEPVSPRSAPPLPALNPPVACSCQGLDVLRKPDGDAILKDMTFDIRQSQITMIVGPVGCGKSLFLKLLLGEVATSGKIHTTFARAAYCGQSPWLRNTTIKENILGPLRLDSDWYGAVVHACCLEHDFQTLPLQDKTVVGSGGAALSGGQQKRIALARALYAKENVVLLDDVLTGLDSTTEELLFGRVFGSQGLLKQRGSTVVLVTNSVRRLPYADHIIALGSTGEIFEQGTYQKLQQSSGYIASLQIDGEASSNEKADTTTVANAKTQGLAADETSPETDRRLGDSTLYLYYINSVGWGNVAVFIFLCSAFVFAIIFPQYWVTWWSEANEVAPNQRVAYYVGIYFFLVVLSVVSLGSACGYLMYAIFAKAAKKMHTVLLDTAMNAQLSSFTATDIGVTINRFSQDLELIDMELPLAIFSTCVVLLTCIAQTVVICMSSSYLAAAIPVAFAALYSIQMFYLRTSRQLRILDIEAKSPLFSQFLETLTGLGTIRAFGWGNDFVAQNRAALEASQKPHYGLLCVQRWLNLVLGLLVSGIAVVTVSIAVVMKGSNNGGFVGLALLNIVSLGTQLQGFIVSWATLESALGAIARVRSFPLETKVEDRSATHSPPSGWPIRGTIEFQNVSAYHERPRRLVLDKIAFSIEHGQKVALCGRTGSGKSSLISVLCRILEVDSGSVLIDGQDVSTLDHHELRSRLTVITQDPYIFNGTIRKNLDPTGESSGSDLESVLRTVQLWKIVSDMGGLDAEIVPDSFSFGQRQLMCLARGVLRKRSIVILDEATSSVDIDTENLMQAVIRDSFKGATVISITHKLEHTMDFDKIGVLQDGYLVEYGSPATLLATPGSLFGQLYLDSAQ